MTNPAITPVPGAFDLLQNVFEFLSAQELTKLESISTDIQRLAKHNYLWRLRYDAEYQFICPTGQYLLVRPYKKAKSINYKRAQKTLLALLNSYGLDLDNLANFYANHADLLEFLALNYYDFQNEYFKLFILSRHFSTGDFYNTETCQVNFEVAGSYKLAFQYAQQAKKVEFLLLTLVLKEKIRQLRANWQFIHFIQYPYLFAGERPLTPLLNFFKQHPTLTISHLLAIEYQTQLPFLQALLMYWLDLSQLAENSRTAEDNDQLEQIQTLIKNMTKLDLSNLEDLNLLPKQANDLINTPFLLVILRHYSEQKVLNLITDLLLQKKIFAVQLFEDGSFFLKHASINLILRCLANGEKWSQERYSIKLLETSWFLQKCDIFAIGELIKLIDYQHELEKLFRPNSPFSAWLVQQPREGIMAIFRHILSKHYYLDKARGERTVANYIMQNPILLNYLTAVPFESTLPHELEMAQMLINIFKRSQAGKQYILTCQHLLQTLNTKTVARIISSLPIKNKNQLFNNKSFVAWLEQQALDQIYQLIQACYPLKIIHSPTALVPELSQLNLIIRRIDSNYQLLTVDELIAAALQSDIKHDNMLRISIITSQLINTYINDETLVCLKTLAEKDPDYAKLLIAARLIDLSKYPLTTTSAVESVSKSSAADEIAPLSQQDTTNNKLATLITLKENLLAPEVVADNESTSQKELASTISMDHSLTSIVNNPVNRINKLLGLLLGGIYYVLISICLLPITYFASLILTLPTFYNVCNSLSAMTGKTELQAINGNFAINLLINHTLSQAAPLVLCLSPIIAACITATNIICAFISGSTHGWQSGTSQLASSPFNHSNIAIKHFDNSPIKFNKFLAITFLGFTNIKSLLKELHANKIFTKEKNYAEHLAKASNQPANSFFSALKATLNIKSNFNPRVEKQTYSSPTSASTYLCRTIGFGKTNNTNYSAVASESEAPKLHLQ